MRCAAEKTGHERGTVRRGPTGRIVRGVGPAGGLHRDRRGRRSAAQDHGRGRQDHRAARGASSTAAYFEIRNTGASRDTLLYADSPVLGGSALRRPVRPSGTGSTDRVRAVDVPAGGTVRMAPDGLGVMIVDPPALKPGQTVRYNLWFRRSGKVGVRAPVTADAQ
ncbi:copper chaperone PCu(A)C [Streptomyces tendae]|uniref:copper chaperone PCu(A)C n=1 Tax=Streptomyces tendae TaxID=1932 RepID=UPI0036C2F6B9